MATTSPDNLRSPNPGDAYNLTSDWANSMNDVQAALILRDNNVFKGTASARAAFTATATDGMLWADTDSIKMIWRKAGAAWVPAVWSWSGTTSEMNAFAAPNGFKWKNTSNSLSYLRIGGSWRGDPFRVTLTPVVSGGGVTSGWYYANDSTYTFPAGSWSTAPKVVLNTSGTGFIVAQIQSVSATTVVYGVMRLGAAPAANTRVELQAWAS